MKAHGIAALTVFAAIACGSAGAQDAPLLTPDEAVRIGLQNNYSIALARNETAIAVNNRQSGIGPFLPTAAATADHTGNLDGSGTPVTTVGAAAGVDLFSGFQSYYGYRELKAEEKSATLGERIAVEATLESILDAYYGIANEKLQLAAIREQLAASRDRANLADRKLEVGSGSRLDQLQAQADLNADSSSLLSEEIALREAKIQLNRLLARDPAETFDVPDTIPVDAGLPVDAWSAGLSANNAGLLQARAQQGAAEAALAGSRGAYLPTLSGGVSYSTAPDAFNSAAVSAGPDRMTYSVNLTVPLFDGLRTRQNAVNARIALRSTLTSLKSAEEDARAQFEQARGRYITGLQQVALEEQNLTVARKQAEAAQERYRVGAGTPLEFRDAQQKLLAARGRLADARLNTQSSELALKRLAGVLVTPAADAERR